ncbi:MAG: polyprenyl synthetase family protein [Ignavibacteriae bacterium]|nr:polyprenyl synthetase family protein [Ignavibacteriota bacterium]MCB9243760.1 polyprenyl synthetase family protein [Ignavibacteriales bacterium]
MDKYYDRYLSYKTRIDGNLFSFIEKKSPAGLYDPMNYVLNGGGKRIRPMITILSCEAFGGSFEDSIDAAAAVEILHNFTLVHDDIMDSADTRRGNETVYKKWDVNTAILAGDGLLGLAYRSLLRTNSARISEIAKVFTESMIEVCEGQSFDTEFEDRNNVTHEEYLMMIGMKTSRLLEACAVIGVLIADGSDDDIALMKNYAENIGLAFQIQDDLLDITADEKEFGKMIGGDIKAGKKTYLLIKALEEAADEQDIALLQKVTSKSSSISDEEIHKVKEIYTRLGIIDESTNQVKSYTEEADSYLEKLPSSEAKEMLKWFSGMLLGRSF